MLALSYILGVVFILSKAGLWHSGLIKMTIMWSLTAMVVLFSHIQSLAKKRGALTNAILGNFKIIVILEFIAHFYTFSLLAELFIVPLSALLGMLQAVNEMKTQDKNVGKLLSFFLGMFGIFLFYNAVENIWANSDTFFTKNTLDEFSIPLVLSTAFLPFVYLQSLYLKYDSIFCHYRIYFSEKDKAYARVAQHYIFWQTLLSFKLNTKAMNLLHRNLTTDTASSIKGIASEIRAIKRLLAAEKQAKPVQLKDGWSPFLARHFLDEAGFETDYYSPIMSGEFGWISSSNSISIEERGYPKNSICYYVTGTEHVATALKLTLYVHNPDNAGEAKQRFQEIATLLFQKAFDQEIAPSFEKKIRKGKPFRTSVLDKILEMRDEDLSFNDTKDYALHLYIRNTDAQHYR